MHQSFLTGAMCLIGAAGSGLALIAAYRVMIFAPRLFPRSVAAWALAIVGAAIIMWSQSLPEFGHRLVQNVGWLLLMISGVISLQLCLMNIDPGRPGFDPPSDEPVEPPRPSSRRHRPRDWVTPPVRRQSCRSKQPVSFV